MGLRDPQPHFPVWAQGGRDCALSLTKEVRRRKLTGLMLSFRTVDSWLARASAPHPALIEAGHSPGAAGPGLTNG